MFYIINGKLYLNKAVCIYVVSAVNFNVRNCLISTQIEQCTMCINRQGSRPSHQCNLATITIASTVARQPSPLNIHITHKFSWMFHIPYYLATWESVIIHLIRHFICCWIYVIQFGMFRNGQRPPIFFF